MNATVYSLPSSTILLNSLKSRPQAILDLCYCNIVVTLLRDPQGGPHRFLLECTYKFTKQFLGMKEA